MRDDADARRERVLGDRDYQTLIHAVVSDPADDLPRMAIADFLDDAGQTNRARLIRCMLEMVPQPGDPEGLRRWRELEAEAVLTDREPWCSVSGVWRWVRPADDLTPEPLTANERVCVLPEEICGDDEYFRANLAGPFGSVDEAVEALSRAAVAYGRRAAGLPTLTDQKE